MNSKYKKLLILCVSGLFLFSMIPSASSNVSAASKTVERGASWDYGGGVTITGTYTYSNLASSSGYRHSTTAKRGPNYAYSGNVYNGTAKATAYGAPWDTNSQAFYSID